MSLPTRPDCGGIYGTSPFGSRYYAGHLKCAYVPPNPPAPTPSAKGYANGRKRQPKEEDLDDLLFIITCWNAIPRQNASRHPIEAGGG